MGHHKCVHVLVKSSPNCITVFILGNTSEIGTVTAANIVPTTQVSNDSEVTGQEGVSSMSAQVESIGSLKDTSDMVRTDLKDILQKLNLSGMKDWESSLKKQPKT